MKNKSRTNLSTRILAILLCVMMMLSSAGMTMLEPLVLDKDEVTKKGVPPKGRPQKLLLNSCFLVNTAA